MSYEGLSIIRSDSEMHLGGNVNVGDPFTYAPSVWRYLIDRLCLKSVLDLGSGIGNASFFFAKHGLNVVAIDGLKANVDKSLHPCVLFDLTKASVVTKVDFVHCQEVAEHIPEEHVGNLIQSLACGKFILMTHALPGQLGHHHVNCRPSAYWVDKLAESDCSLMQDDTNRVRELAKRDGADFLARTGLLFVNNKRI